VLNAFGNAVGYARVVLTDNRGSMLMQLLQIKMNGMLLEGEVLSRCAKYMLAMLDTEASSESIYGDLQQLEEHEQAERAEQENASDLRKDAEGSVACEAGTEACLLLTCLQSAEGVQLRRSSPALGVADRPAAAQDTIARAWQQVVQPSHHL
jgi:hypothetical protein